MGRDASWSPRCQTPASCPCRASRPLDDGLHGTPADAPWTVHEPKATQKLLTCTRSRQSRTCSRMRMRRWYTKGWNFTRKSSQESKHLKITYVGSKSKYLGKICLPFSNGLDKIYFLLARGKEPSREIRLRCNNRSNGKGGLSRCRVGPGRLAEMRRGKEIDAMATAYPLQVR